MDDIYTGSGYELSIGIRYKDGKSFDVTGDMLKKFLTENDMSSKLYELVRKNARRFIRTCGRKVKERDVMISYFLHLKKI